ncbi:MAG: histidinol dehydrogenase [Endomicrobiales bacterium]|nr:histidinol dehydrogenase [Endomicrobiales bacterium]
MNSIKEGRKISRYISGLISRVRKGGDRAVSGYIRKFDGVNVPPARFRVKKAELNAAAAKIDKEIAASLRLAASNIRNFHKKELLKLAKAWRQSRDGIITGQMMSPVEKVGVYVPGGRYPYPSTVLMTVIPAKVAGVKRVVVVTPPKSLTQEILYAAKLAGADEIYRVGGPAAVAALAFGTRNIPKTDMIVGPGNKYVNEAKRQVFGEVGIDSLAGPSEIAIIADNTADAEFVAADIEAQLEHDPDARALLLSDSAALISKVRKAMRRKPVKSASCSLAKVPMNRAVEIANAAAPEHLEVIVKNPARVLSRIRNAGAVFVGSWSPVASGDYLAGPSHALPTGGSARFSSGVSVATFIKRTSYMEFSKKGFMSCARRIEILAGAERLRKHGRSIKIRREKK